MGAVAVGVAIGAVVGGGAAAIQSGGDFDAIWKGALVGAAAGGIGGWAAPALAPTLGITSAAGIGALGGGIAGVSGGLLSTALNGGNSSDYLKAGLFGGVTGAATGALGGYLSGGESAAGAQPVDASGNMVSGTPYTTDVTGATTPLSDAGASTLTTAPAASGMGAGMDASGAVQASVTGATPTADAGSFGSPFGAEAAAPTSGLSDPGGFYTGTNAPTNTGFGNTVEPFDVSGGVNFSGSDSSFGTFGSANPEVGTLDKIMGNDSYVGTQLSGGSPWSMDKLFGEGNNMLGKVMMGNMMGNALKGVGSVAGMNEARQNQQQLMDLYNTQMNQYNKQNAAANAYQDTLAQTYSDPNAYLNSPEALAARQQAMQKLLAQNAMAGRRTAGLSMQNQLMQNQLANLANYRTGLSNASRSAYMSPTGLSSTLQAAQAQSPTGNLMAGLGSIFAPAATYYMMG